MAHVHPVDSDPKLPGGENRLIAPLQEQKSESTHFKHDAAVAHLMGVPVPRAGGRTKIDTEILGQISRHTQALV